MPKLSHYTAINISSMSGKYYRGKFQSGFSNPEEEWIRSETLIGRREDSGLGSAERTRKEKIMQGSEQKMEKSAVEMMKDMLRGVNLGQQTNPYYSKEAHQNVANLLTSQYKRNNYIASLQQQIPYLSEPVAKNYKLLSLLLREATKGDIAVTNGQEGIEVSFNRKVIQDQQVILERLRKEKARKEAEEKAIVNEYQSIIENLQKITEQLIKNKQEQTRYK